MNEPERKRRGPITLLCESQQFRRRAALALVCAALVYLASFGPACWWWSEHRYWNVSKEHVRTASTVFVPIGWMMQYAPEPIPSLLRWYATLYLDADILIVPSKWDGRQGATARP